MKILDYRKPVRFVNYRRWLHDSFGLHTLRVTEGTVERVDRNTVKAIAHCIFCPKKAEVEQTNYW